MLLVEERHMIHPINPVNFPLVCCDARGWSGDDEANWSADVYKLVIDQPFFQTELKASGEENLTSSFAYEIETNLSASKNICH